MKNYCRPSSLLGKPCVALDYELTAYWGQCIAVSASYRVTLKYYAGIGKGWQTKEFHHIRVWATDIDDSLRSEDSPFFNRQSVYDYSYRSARWAIAMEDLNLRRVYA